MDVKITNSNLDLNLKKGWNTVYLKYENGIDGYFTTESPKVDFEWRIGGE